MTWRPIFPLRPIVFGGDDLTFVCHGRIGLALAARYLQYFEAARAPKAGRTQPAPAYW